MAHYPKILDFVGSGGSQSIDLSEVAFGTGTGITSSNRFKWDEANQNLLASTGSCINSSTANKSSIIAGASNSITNQDFSSIIGGLNNIMTGSDYSSIIGGSNSFINASPASSIMGGEGNEIRQTSKGTLVHSNSILGGTNNLILGTSSGSTIISGSGSTINDSNNSVILGGIGLSLSNEDSVVHVSRLKIATASNVSASRLLVWDTDNYVKWRDASSISGSGGSGSAINLTEVAFGTGTGITSSNRFTFTVGNTNLIVASSSSILGGLESAIIAGRSNTIGSFNNRTVILSSCASCTTGNSISESSIISSVCSVSNFRQSTIIAGCTNCMCGSSGVSNVMFGSSNSIFASGGVSASYASSILGGRNNTLLFSSNSSILGGSGSCINSRSSAIVAGNGNIINSDVTSVIMASCNSCICGPPSTVCESSIISSICSFSNFRRSTIVAGTNNCMIGESGLSSVMFGECNRISSGAGTFTSCNSSILGGCRNVLSCSGASTIVGGASSSIANTSCYSSIIGGRGNIIKNYSRWANISGGQFNCIYGRSNLSATSDESVIVGGFLNRIICSEDNAIIGGFCNLIYGGPTGSWFSTIVGGQFNCIRSESEGNSIIGGFDNTIENCSYESSIIGGKTNHLNCYVGYSSIIGGQCNNICYAGDRDSIIGGYKNQIFDFSFNSSIIGGRNSELSYFSLNSTIIGGLQNCICCSDNSVIIGGTGSIMNYSSGSVILGGQGLSLNTENNVVYSSCLKLSTASNDNSVDKILVWDTSDNYVKYRDDSSISGGSIPAGITGSTPYYTGSSWTYSNRNIFNNGSRVGIGTQSGATPSSTLQVFGSLSLPIRTVSTSTTVGINDFTIIWVGGIGQTVSLPKADLAPNRLYAFKTTGSPVDILASSGEAIVAINSSSYYTLPSKGAAAIIQSDGIDTWYVINDVLYPHPAGTIP
jgi:hypothetical protein